MFCDSERVDVALVAVWWADRDRLVWPAGAAALAALALRIVGVPPIDVHGLRHSDVAIESSDLTLMRGVLSGVPTAIGLSRRTFRTILQSLCWAFGYNVAAIPLAALGLLNPIIAGAAMGFSSVSVVANSQRLLRFRESTLRAAPAPAKRSETRAARTTCGCTRSTRSRS